MAEIFRRPQAQFDLIEIWTFIADDNEVAADRVLDRIDSVLRMLSEQPAAGRARPENRGETHKKKRQGRADRV